MAIKEFVSPRAKREVFILGAGFSRAIHATMPLLSELPPLVLDRLGQRSAEAQTTPFFDENIEMALTYLSQRHPWLSESEHLRNRALALDLASAIGAELNERTKEVLNNRPPEWLIRLVYWMHRHQAAIITFNYDTLLERAFSFVPMDEGGETGSSCVFWTDLLPRGMFAAVEGSLASTPISTAEVLKLHGSLNWYYSGQASYLGELIHESGYRGWTSDEDRYRQHATYGRVPLIVPPVTDKSAYFEHEGIRGLWNLAAQRLRHAERIFCIGYSLPRTDLAVRFLLKSAGIQEQAPIHVVDLRSEPSVELSSLLGRPVDERYMGVKDPVHALADDLIEEDLACAVASSSIAAEAGPVQRAIRSKVNVGDLFTAFQRDEPVAVRDIADSGLTLEAGMAGVPIHYPWSVLEAVVAHIEAANLYPPDARHVHLGGGPNLDTLFRTLHPWATTRYVLPVLDRARVAEAYYYTNMWNVRLTEGFGGTATPT
jgi:hypothetical protein